MTKTSGESRLGVDVGGTFIDYAVVDNSTGSVRFDKQTASASRLHEEFMTGLARLRLTGQDIAQLFHGTTVATNTLVQERGARVALITTAGFRDVLEIGRGGRKEIYNLRYAPPAPLVSKDLRFEALERLDSSGAVLHPLSEDSVAQVIAQVRQSGVEAVAICLLHAYANPVHELELAAAIAEELPEVMVTVSHEAASEWREFERTSTSVINSYIQPLFATYLRNLEISLEDDGYSGSIGIMQSNGGVLTSQRAAALPVRTLMSGPAGGVVASRGLARELTVSNAICADVGGTTFDVALVIDGDVVEKPDATVGGRPVLGTMVDITSVGAGGGSIAWIDTNNLLKVGPESAGADPGPVCFGAGGSTPTVTDAQILLGRLDPLGYLGGRMTLDFNGARDAIRVQVAEPLGLSVEQAALGILRIAETNMSNAIRSITVERGLDPRDFSLIAYGGGGGLFATLLAEELGVTNVIAPAAAANFSAWGILSSDYREDAVMTKILDLESSTSALRTHLSELGEEIKDTMSSYGPREDVSVAFTVEVRFIGQHHTVPVQLSNHEIEDEAGLEQAVSTRFRRLHDRMYGPRTRDSQLEIVTLRAHGTLRVETPRLEQLEPHSGTVPSSTREIWFNEKPIKATVYMRDHLGSGYEFHGPAVVEESTNTTLVPPGWMARVEPSGHLFLTFRGVK